MIGDLTKSETMIVLQGLNRLGKLNHRNYEAVMGWATNAKLDSDLLVLIFEKYLEVDVSDDGELRFMPTELGMASPRRQELARLPV